MNHQFQVGDWETKCLQEYGNVWRIKGCLGVSVYYRSETTPPTDIVSWHN